ncbi:hypothetical protein Fmac_018237 [Flemingia macrophylla]|uniref:DUF7745 domain-containing protein n=1 Tax=Flemingia macrophylla TaxID=520843 RepID=A0ABD1M4F7_9FABA
MRSPFEDTPLMGLMGCIPYSPRLAMRQLMKTQTIPSKEELRGLCFFCNPSHRDEILAICRAWEKPIYNGDGGLGKPKVTISSDHEKWRSDRGVPKPSTQEAPTAVDGELQEKVDAMTKRMKIMGAQMRAHEDKNEESSLIIDGLQRQCRQCKKKDQDIEWLKDECTATNEEVAHAAKNLENRFG